MEPQTIRGPWTGVDSLSDEQVRALADALQVGPDDLLGPDPLQAVFDHIAHPLFKQAIQTAADQSGLSEGETRDAVRSEYALAARDDSTVISDARLMDAIKRVPARPVAP
jgi:hypothetical protein